jgi:hypothetical protein
MFTNRRKKPDPKNRTTRRGDSKLKQNRHRRHPTASSSSVETTRPQTTSSPLDDLNNKGEPMIATATGKKSSQEKPKIFGQQILDCICDRVARDAGTGMGFACWSIGKTAQIVSYVAEMHKLDIKSVAGGLSDLINKKYFCSELWNRDEQEDEDNYLAINAKAWLQYTHWTPDNRWVKACEEEKLDWFADGMNTLDLTYDYEQP